MDSWKLVPPERVRLEGGRIMMMEVLGQKVDGLSVESFCGHNLWFDGEEKKCFSLLLFKLSKNVVSIEAVQKSTTHKNTLICRLCHNTKHGQRQRKCEQQDWLHHHVQKAPFEHGGGSKQIGLIDIRGVNTYKVQLSSV